MTSLKDGGGCTQKRLSLTSRSVTEDDAVKLFRETGALLEGHFVLRSGRHSRQFFQCARMLEQMPVVERLGAALAERVRRLEATTVVAPAMGGLVIGQEVARQLGSRFVFAEKEEGKLALRRGFEFSTGEKILIVEDVVTQGGRVRETMDIVRSNGGDLRGVALVVERSGGEVNLGVPIFSLLRMQVETFAEEELPEDLRALPAVHPGSR